MTTRRRVQGRPRPLGAAKHVSERGLITLPVAGLLALKGTDG